MNIKWKIIFYIVILAILFFIAALVFDWGRNSNLTPLNSYQQTESTSSEISVFYPKPNDTVSSPIKISGKAKGNWFFEASFPVKLYDENENIIGSGIATAESDWATTSFVNFTAEITYDNSTSTGSGLLVFSNDNPSGDPSFSKSFFVPVKLK